MKATFTSVLLGTSLLSLTSAARVPGTLQLDIVGKREPDPSMRLRRRAGNTVTAPLTENPNFSQYYAAVEVGTPPQKISLVVDTGSSDVWVVAAEAPICAATSGACALGTFDYKKSSTFLDNGPGEFQDQYADGTSTTGDFFQDTFSIGGASVTGMEMGIALNTSIPKGIMGIAFDNGEAGGTVQYPNLVDTMVNQSVIATQAYSLWLDDYAAKTGSLLFGGIDTGKFTGPLYNIAIYPSAQTGVIDAFTVAFTGLTVTSSSGTDSLTPSGYAEAVILDSGTTFTYVPDELATAIYNIVGAEYSSDAGLTLCPCSTGTVSGTLNFQFAGANGPVIKVPISELVYPIYNTDGSQPTLQDGQPVCSFGIEPASSLGSDVALLFGDTLLRSAYVVYDLYNQRIGLAPTNFGSTESNVVAFESLGAQIPQASTVSNEIAASQTASAGNGVGETAYPTAVGGGASTASVNAQFTGNAGPAFSTAYTNTKAAAATATGKKNAGEVSVRPLAWQPFALVGLTACLMAVGGGMLLL